MMNVQHRQQPTSTPIQPPLMAPPPSRPPHPRPPPHPHLSTPPSPTPTTNPRTAPISLSPGRATTPPTRPTSLPHLPPFSQPPTSKPQTLTSPTTPPPISSFSHHQHNNPHTPVTNVDAVLPRGTLVRIIGNNRTKYEIHGLKGLVCSAQTLGGWHEVELVDWKGVGGGGVRKGDRFGRRIVKVQRNALEVLKMGEGGIKVIDNKESHSGSGGNGGGGGGVWRNGGVVKRRKGLGVLRARIEKLDLGSLEKYRRVYGLKFGEGEPTREELVWAVKKHFARQKVDEKVVIDGFLKRIYRGVPGGGRSG